MELTFAVSEGMLLLLAFRAGERPGGAPVLSARKRILGAFLAPRAC